MKKLTIAIDGYSSCGKSTLAKAIAKKLNYVFVDTGAMYRGVSLYALRNNWVTDKEVNAEEIVGSLADFRLTFEFNEESQRRELHLNGENVEKQIRTLEVAGIVSKVAAIKEVRTKLVDRQREMGKEGGVVMDGRDIGSVVFPDAELKIFVTADPRVRAKRRFDELTARGDELTIKEVEDNLAERDLLDSTRKESPLVRTEDARLLDNTDLNQEEQLKIALDWVEEISKSEGCAV